MIPENASNEALLERMANEPEALEMLYRRWGSRWAGLIRAAGVSGQDVPDVIQSVLIEVWKHANRFDSRRGSFEAWILQIVRHRTIDFVRRKKLDVVEWSEHMGATGPPDHSVGLRDWVGGAMTQLSDHERRVIELMYYGGFAIKEIAAMWHVPVGTVKSWSARGLKKLRANLSEERKS